PYGMVSTVQNNLAYAPGCSYRWDVYGNKEHIAGAPFHEVQKFFEQYYRPDNACLVLSGDVYPEQALALIKKYFEDIPPGTTPRSRPVFDISFRQGNAYQRVEDDIPLETLFLSYHFDGFTSNDILAAEVLASILSDG